jgi:hypothetical protein
MAAEPKQTLYDKIFEQVFLAKYRQNPASKAIEFNKDDIRRVADELGITIKNIPDIIYTYRARRELPESVLATGNWIVKPSGKGRYMFIQINRSPFVTLQEGLAAIEVLNATPEIVEKYGTKDEQGLLSVIRYNRLVDIFTEITCFHLQSHIRTTIQHEGQIEVDDVYVGIDQEGREYILPLEAKGSNGRDKFGWVQISNMVRYATQYFPQLLCPPLATKAHGNHVYMVEFDDVIDHQRMGIRNIELYSLIRQEHQAD